MKLIYPLSKKGTKTSGFGYRVHPIKKTKKHHNGIDIGIPDGTGVNAVADGEVVRSDMRDYKGYGNLIIIKHSVDGETFYSAYAHLTKRLVDVGDKVTQGEKIAESGGGQGLAGGGGLSTGPHLHFEIRKSENGDWVNPEPYINGTEIVKGEIGDKKDDKKDDKEDDKKDESKLLSKLVVTYGGLSGKSKDIVDNTISYLKTKGITNPYAIVVICVIILEKNGLLVESKYKTLLESKEDLPKEIQSSINKLKTVYGLNITQKHIDKEFEQEGNWRPDNGGVDKTAESKINELIKDCKNKFPYVKGGIVSGYRSYSDQVTNFGTKATSRGIDDTQKANTIPGFSQHHTGKAFDIFSVDTSWWDKNSDVKNWVAENAKNYGFDVTYKKQGPLRIAEPWHLYYVGGESEKPKPEESFDINSNVDLLIKDKETINNFKSLDEAIKYYSDIELSDGTKISKEKLKSGSSKFEVKSGSETIDIKNVEDFLKALLKIPEIGAKVRKERGLDENVKLVEEIHRMKDLMKKIL